MVLGLGSIQANPPDVVWLHEIRPDNNPWADLIREKVREKEPDLVITTSLRAFLAEAMPLAQRIYQEYRIPVSATLAQAVYESAYGNSRLAREYHNYFGLKAGHWKGAIAHHLLTRDSGQWVYADFRAYPTMEAGFLGYAEFLQDPPYRSVSRDITGVEFIRQILTLGYCPDPDYLQNIQRIIASYQLERQY
jgi:flagellum-specific peptidoglycan hydrolase FlgJ